MATSVHGWQRSPSRLTVYLAVLIAAFVIVAAGTIMWLSTDTNSGTNALATDEQSITRVP